MMIIRFRFRNREVKAMKKWMAILLTLVMVSMLFSGSAFAEESGFEFSEWNPDAPALKALIEYVEDVTNEASPD